VARREINSRCDEPVVTRLDRRFDRRFHWFQGLGDRGIQGQVECVFVERQRTVLFLFSFFSSNLVFSNKSSLQSRSFPAFVRAVTLD
jgi:hypothetical protein